jgi:sulfatase modifying factor 1
MIRLDGGTFWMGSDKDEGFPADGEGPARQIKLDPFYLDTYPVTKRQFDEFVNATGYRTEAERFGWSFVFQGHLPQDGHLIEARIAAAPWWCKVMGANWQRPFGPDSADRAKPEHPAVHIAWNDAMEYSNWAGKRLPTEAEWEYAARGGLEEKLYPWGDELTPGGKHLCNIWQGDFPDLDVAEDGYDGIASVDAFPPNQYGFYSITGNAWEWCADWFHASHHVTATRANPVGPEVGTARVMKGGSYLCHRSYCNRYRVAARTSNTPDSSAGNVGFRCARDV